MPQWSILLIIGLIIALDQIVDYRKATADERRTKRLIERAKREFPHNAMTESLGDLYQQLYKDIVQANIDERPIERLRHDRDLIAAEVCRIWKEEINRKQEAIEAGSSFLVSSAGGLRAKSVRVPLLPSTPKRPATAHLAKSE